MTNWIDKVDEQTLTDVLGELMSAVSEDCYNAGLMEGTEYVVPELCHRVARLQRPLPWAHGNLGPGLAAVLMKIADRLGHWANLSEVGNYVAFEPWPIPKEYIDEIDHWKKLKK